MKNYILILFLFSLSFSVSAQKTIEKSIDYNKQKITVDLDFANNIEIKTWEKNSIFLNADLNTEDGKYLDRYQLDITQNDSEIRITSDALPVFEAFQKNYSEKHFNNIIIKNGKSYSYTQPNLEHTFNYVIYIPKGAVVEVSSITGQINSEYIEGNLTTDLISGDINIKEYKGNLDLKTISGSIDLKMKNTSLTAETLQGNIYADEKLEFTASDKIVGQKITGKTLSAVNNLKLNTISGDLFLRY